MTDWTPPDNYYNLNLRNGHRWALEWSSGERLSALLDQLTVSQMYGRVDRKAFEMVMSVEGSMVQIDISEISALEERTPEQRQRWKQFYDLQKAEGLWDDE